MPAHSDTDPGFGQDPNVPGSPGHLPGDVEADAPGHDLPDHTAPETPGHLPGDDAPGAPGHDLPPAVQPPEGGVAVPGHPIELPGSAEHPIELPDGSEQIPEGYRKPNILVIFGDDIGHDNISWYNRGLLGHRTPNIDRIANEGAGFTDAYAEQSCTAGRASFLLGQSGIRTGLTRIGFPGDLFGISLNDPTLALLLKSEGYTTAQFGKNHLGDRDWHLPTVHGFDRFFGNLYHLQAEEEPEHPDFPANPLYPRPRGVLDCRNTGLLRQEITDTGPLTKERMPTIDDEFADAAEAWIREQHAAGKPWFCWTNSSRMHIWTRLKEESEGKTGLGIYPDGMVEHDAWVGRQLDLLDELGIAEDTIVLYTTDNGAEVFSWPDGGCTPFRNEKNSMYDGAYRVPMMMRWPGHIPAGAECNGIISHLDLLPTLMAAAGRPNIKQLLLAGFAVGDQNRPWKACLDGYNMLPALTGAEGAKWPRSEFFYINDQGEVSALRYNQYKIAFRVNEKQGFAVWSEIALQLKFPYVSNIRTDPYERYNFEPLMGWPQWMIEHAFVLIGAVFLIEAFERSVREWPPHFGAGNVQSVTSTGDTTEDLDTVAAFSEEGVATSAMVTEFKGSAEQLAALATWLRTCTVSD